jgi:hypothetical protein
VALDLDNSQVSSQERVSTGEECLERVSDYGPMVLAVKFYGGKPSLSAYLPPKASTSLHIHRLFSFSSDMYIYGLDVKTLAGLGKDMVKLEFTEMLRFKFQILGFLHLRLTPSVQHGVYTKFRDF